MFEDLWQVISNNLPLLTAVGVLVTAMFEWLRYRSRYELPVVCVNVYGRATDAPQAVTFKLEAGTDRWRVTRVRLQSVWRRHLTQDGRPLNTGDGQIEGYRVDGPWQRCLRYHPPVSDGIFGRHPQAPRLRNVLFTVVLRSNPRVRRHVVGSVRLA